MYRETKIAIPIFKKDKNSALKAGKDYIKKGADILELRIDGLSNPNTKIVKDIIEEINFPTIITNRKKSEGGFFEGSEEERVAILQECSCVADYVDIELQTDLKYIKSIKNSAVKTIISFHDFEKTPPVDDLLAIVKKEKKLGDIAKIAVMPKNLEDTIIVLAILSRCKDTIAISMGELGSYTRIIASKFSSPITFASGDDTTAPGQIDIETMKLMLNMVFLDHDDLIKDVKNL
ncbi:MAG: type I 3-dehydroquinate dehydratase [Methanobacteriaceae archaeon]|nr:type I 3-dehydroquinate dehydratase [Candidatus Methanorudis spinitermitis]